MNPKSLLLAVGLVSLSFANLSRAQVVFSDTFSATNTFNINENLGSPRQTGTYITANPGGVAWNEYANPAGGIPDNLTQLGNTYPNTMNLFPNPAQKVYLAVRTAADFSSDLNLVSEYDITFNQRVVYGGSNTGWLQFSFGATNSVGDDFTPLFPNQATAGFSVIFEADGSFQSWSSGTPVATGTITLSGGDFQAIRFNVQNTGSDAIIRMYANGVEELSYTRTGGFGAGEGHLIFGGFTSGGDNAFNYNAVQNLAVTVVPEPSAFALLVGFGCGLMLMRRMRRERPLTH